MGESERLIKLGVAMIVAWLLFPIVFILNILSLLISGYSLYGVMKDSAISLDRYANYEFRHILNKYLIKPDGHPFGHFEETISYVLACNTYTLTPLGEAVCWVLETLDEGHLQRQIEWLNKQ